MTARLAVERCNIYNCLLCDCRSYKLHLPYFNLADDVESTDASLVIEIITSAESEQPTVSAVAPDNDLRSTTELREVPESFKRNCKANLSRTVAVGSIDVQTALSNSGSFLMTEGKHFPLTLKRGEAPSLGFTFPEFITVEMGVVFSKASEGEEVRGTRRVEGGVPVCFLVATTLFDCSTVLKEAELRVYTQLDGSGDARLLCRQERGEIGKLSLE